MKSRLNVGSYGALIRDTLALTPSGALSPGALSASAAAIGAQLGIIGGVAVALGHMLAELPYVFLLTYSSARMRGILDRWGWLMGLVSSAFILFFAALLLISAASAWDGEESLLSGGRSAQSLLGAVGVGAVLTLFNPFFLLWWLSVGLPLVEGAARNGGKGFAVMYMAHVWMDYAWLAFLAFAAGLLAAHLRLYAILMVALAAMLVYYGMKIGRESVSFSERGS